MITVFYNGVALKDCVVKRFQQEVVYDRTNTDVMYSRFTVTVESTVVESDYMDLTMVDPSPNHFAFTEIDSGTGSSADVMARIGGRLGENRGDFHLLLGGQTPADVAENYERPLLIAAGRQEVLGSTDMKLNPRFSGSAEVPRFNVLDVENGPHVKDVTVEQVYGGVSMRASATFVVSRALCFEGYDTDKPNIDNYLQADQQHGVILNNRWSMTESKDANWRTTRVISGEIRTRHSDYFVQAYRQMIVPPLMKGYRRISQNFASDADQTLMRYVFQDRQEYAAPPEPAVDWDCTHTESTTSQGAVQVAQLDIRLTGTQDVDKTQLIGAAGKVLTLRISDLQNVGDGNHSTYITSMAVIDRLDQPTIQMKATAKYTTSDNTFLSMRVRSMGGGRGGNLTGPDGVPNYDPTVWRTPLAYDGEQPTGLLHCYLQKPCSIWHGMVGEQPYGVQEVERTESVPAYPPDTYEADLIILPSDDVAWEKPDSPGNLLNSNKYNVYQYPYTTYSFATSWESSMGRQVLPISYFPPAAGDDERGKTATVVRLNRGITKLYYEIEAVRVGRYPVIPQLHEIITDANGTEYHLIDRQITTRPPEITADGATKAYGIALRLIYAATREVLGTDSLNPGSIPFDLTQASEQTIEMDEVIDSENRMILNTTGT